MITRDSYVLWVGLAAAILGYLVTAGAPPTEWSYMQWLQAGSVLLAWVSGKLATSPLAGENDANKIKNGGTS
jgi:membrane protein implicated in regulation of membrane protease activity